MTHSTITAAIARIPPGRARLRYEQLVADLGSTVYTVEVPSAPCTLWFVADQQAVRRLKSLGIPRWRVWTLRELQDLFLPFGLSVGSVDEAIGLFLSDPPREDIQMLEG